MLVERLALKALDSVAGRKFTAQNVALGTFEHWLIDLVQVLYKRYYPTSPVTKQLIGNMDVGDVVVLASQLGILGAGHALKQEDMKAIGFTGLTNNLFYRAYYTLLPYLTG